MTDFFFFRFLLTEGILNLIIWFNLILRINPQDPIINIIFPRSPVICLKIIIQESVNYMSKKVTGQSTKYVYHFKNRAS